MTKAKPGKKSGGSKPKAGRSAPQQQQVTAAQLFQQAQIALRFDDFDSAKEALKRACRLEPHNTSLLDAYACLLAELSDDAAKEVLLQAVAAAPTSGHEKFMYLAQLEEEPAASLQYSSQGLALLQSTLEAARADPSQVKEAAALSRSLSKALCAHAEMLLAHACTAREEALAASTPAGQDMPDPRAHPLDGSAVQQIEGLLQQASLLQPKSPEPGQVLASLRSEQGRSEEALAVLRTSMLIWWDPGDSDEEEGEEQEGEEAAAAAAQEAVAMDEDPVDAPGGEGEEEEEAEEEEDEVPSFEFRFECAKLLLELDESTDTAVGVLSSLVEEHDSNPDVWHLLSLALYSGHQYEEALDVALKGQELLRKLRVPKKDDAWASFADLTSAIKEAMGTAATAAGLAGVKQA